MNPYGSPLTIRPARADEGASLTELALRSKATWGYDSAFIEACRAELTVTAEQIESDRFRVMVGEIEGVYIGFYVIEFDESGFELDALFVDPDYTGNGHGRRLLEHAKRTAADLGALRLTVQSDPFAEPFYRAAGATAIGTSESGSIPGRFLPLLRIPLEEDESE